MRRPPLPVFIIISQAHTDDSHTPHPLVPISQRTISSHRNHLSQVQISRTPSLSTPRLPNLSDPSSPLRSHHLSIPSQLHTELSLTQRPFPSSSSGHLPTIATNRLEPFTFCTPPIILSSPSPSPSHCPHLSSHHISPLHHCTWARPTPLHFFFLPSFLSSSPPLHTSSTCPHRDLIPLTLIISTPLDSSPSIRRPSLFSSASLSSSSSPSSFLSIIFFLFSLPFQHAAHPPAASPTSLPHAPAPLILLFLLLLSFLLPFLSLHSSTCTPCAAPFFLPFFISFPSPLLTFTAPVTPISALSFTTSPFTHTLHPHAPFTCAPVSSSQHSLSTRTTLSFFFFLSSFLLFFPSLLLPPPTAPCTTPVHSPCTPHCYHCTSLHFFSSLSFSSFLFPSPCSPPTHTHASAQQYTPHHHLLFFFSSLLLHFLFLPLPASTYLPTHNPAYSSKPFRGAQDSPSQQPSLHRLPRYHRPNLSITATIQTPPSTQPTHQPILPI